MAGWLARTWADHAMPLAVEYVCAQRSIDRQRAKLVPLAAGRVLEVGVGTGLNLPFYDPDRVEEIVAVDPSEALLVRARERARSVRPPVRIVRGSADSIDAPDASFDAVVVTYTLCTVPDPARALAEIARVLAPAGRLLISEHGLAPDRAPRAWQRRLDPVWSRLGGGCHLDRPMRALARDAGFDVGALEERYLPGPRWLNYHYFGALSREAA
ncbi:MAG: methyltransferase domain-containing protein [Sandaracinaceae bacterium]|nr:methyltransferase domain-containing protein [Sandaracinaceae bacterium]